MYVTKHLSINCCINKQFLLHNFTNVCLMNIMIKGDEKMNKKTDLRIIKTKNKNSSIREELLKEIEKLNKDAQTIHIPHVRNIKYT